jgi:hypothetical protein
MSIFSTLSKDDLNKMLEEARRRYEYDDEAADNNQTSYALAIRCKKSRDQYLELIETISALSRWIIVDGVIVAENDVE